VEAVPDRYLYLLTGPLQTVAIWNIAVLLDQLKIFPDHYEHQLALNKAAIRYSEMRGELSACGAPWSTTSTPMRCS
jgi:hypothetical protein